MTLEQQTAGAIAMARPNTNIAEAFMKVEPHLSEAPKTDAVGLVTLSHRADIERCAILFESVDRHVRNASMHYVIVHDEDVDMFSQFQTGSRRVMPVSRFLPRWLRPIPLLRWRGRQYWFSPYGKPVSGWHTQQLAKIEAARSLPETRLCLIDSDVCFFRDFDVASIAKPVLAPFHVYEDGIWEERPRHMRWIATASRLLATPRQDLPADDYIDQVMVWDQATVRDMVERMEAVTGMNWAAAMCRIRDFSEYMIYGTYVVNTPHALARHRRTTQSFTRTHWDADPLGTADILAMLNEASPDEVAFCIQSFGQTPVSVIRTSLEAFYSQKFSKIEAPIVSAPRLDQSRPYHGIPDFGTSTAA